jgi:hypothetical protein
MEMVQPKESPIQNHLKTHLKDNLNLKSMSYRTICSLNLRNQPLISPSTLIHIIPKGALVEKISDSEVIGWWKVTVPSIGNLEGFISSKFVEEVQNIIPQPIDFPQFPKTFQPHLIPSLVTQVKRNSVNGRAFPLNEPNMPFRDGTDLNSKIASIYRIIEFLDVKNSQRYRPTVNNTYCNIYAYDYCYLNNVYIPRVWWIPKAINSIMNNINVPIIYAETVREMNTNSLFDWLNEFGRDFSWRRVFAMEEIQQIVNSNGSVGIICAKNVNPNHSGHITCVLPEDQTKGYRAKMVGGKIVSPLQSQAGRNNLKYFSINWWSNPLKFKGFGFWVNE